MSTTISFEIDETTASQAERIYNALGMNTQMALSLFIRRTVMDGKLPLAAVTSQPTNQASAAQPSSAPETAHHPEPKQTGKPITEEMAEAVWDAFLRMRRFGYSANSLASEVSDATGMNPGSAFIYLTILDNLVKGKPNTRNMKMADLETYLRKIKAGLPDSEYQNALLSLELSLDYWDKPQFGKLAQKVSEFLERNERKTVTENEVVTTYENHKQKPTDLSNLSTLENKDFALATMDLICASKNAERIIAALSDAQYCKEQGLGVGFCHSVVKETAASIATRAEIYESYNHPRYYNETFEIGSRHFVIMNDWYKGGKHPNNREAFLSWLSQRL